MTDLRHVQGAANPAADALSRLGMNALHAGNSSPVVDLRELALAQVDDAELARLRTDSALQEDIPFPFTYGLKIVCDVSTGSQHSYIPPSFRQVIFDTLHAISQPGIRVTGASLQPVLCGQMWTPMFKGGPVPASSVMVQSPKFTDIQLLLSVPLLHLTLVRPQCECEQTRSLDQQARRAGVWGSTFITTPLPRVFDALLACCKSLFWMSIFFVKHSPKLKRRSEWLHKHSVRMHFSLLVTQEVEEIPFSPSHLSNHATYPPAAVLQICTQFYELAVIFLHQTFLTAHIKAQKPCKSNLLLHQQKKVWWPGWEGGLKNP